MVGCQDFCFRASRATTQYARLVLVHPMPILFLDHGGQSCALGRSARMVNARSSRGGAESDAGSQGDAPAPRRSRSALTRPSAPGLDAELAHDPGSFRSLIADEPPEALWRGRDDVERV